MQFVHPRADGGRKLAAARREVGVRVGGRSGKRTRHRLDTRRQAAIDRAGAAIGGLGEIGDPRRDDARALVRGFGKRRETRVEFLRAPTSCVGERGLVPVERSVDCGSVGVEGRAQTGTMGLEQRDDLLRVLADPGLELRSIGVKALSDLL